MRLAEERLAGFRLLAPAAFTTDPAQRDRHWHLRKGLFPSVGGMRPTGTAVVIEDVVVPVERLALVLGARARDVAALARAMGLRNQPRITADQLRRSYITIIKRNWHLVPYEQLLALLGWNGALDVVRKFRHRGHKPGLVKRIS